jgi:hypothetical protein
MIEGTQSITPLLYVFQNSNSSALSGTIGLDVPQALKHYLQESLIPRAKSGYPPKK